MYTKLGNGFLKEQEVVEVYWVAGGFIFRHVDSPVHKLEPRVKLLFTVELFILSLLSYSALEIIIALASIFSISFLGRALRRLGRTLIFSAGFAVLIFAINLFVGYPLVDSIILASRFVAIVGSTSLFFLTTSPDELEYVMKWFRLPQDVVFAFVTAVRFVPVLMMDALQIMDAQKSRGLELEKGSLLSRIKNFTPILVPLVVNAVIRSGELAEAMEARAYGAVKKPSSLYELKSNLCDKFVAGISLILFITAIFFYLSY